MWWILSLLLSLTAWAAWYIWDLELWIPIAATAFLFLLALGLFIWRRVSASRAGKALEQAIAQQGALQAQNARPERRAEIQALQTQVQQGISALKQSKLGRGKRSGAAALYSLPWYVIIGPPGAGKTTAIKHSGLVFPFSGAGGGAVRGVGGTRNCDWWFTNEAILLDTAGRYTTQSDDRDEWIAFLQMLLRYRSRQPINGVLVAVSITDLIDANEPQIEAMAKNIRARIDEVMTQLRMVVPVYVLFTKCDLIAGFSEFFGDLRKTERAQAWGATLRLDAPKTDPGKLFDAEFDVLAQRIHARSLKRLVMERSREIREKIYQFPLEFAATKRNLTDFIGTVFQVNSFQGTPIFRGAYFTSGTQEGRPTDRLLARMGQAMGIRPQEVMAAPVVESKSFFLHDVFMNVAFPDADVAARSQAEMRRQQLMRVAVSGSAFALATVVAIPSVLSYTNNRELLELAKADAEAAAKIDWKGPVSKNLDALKPLQERLTTLDGYQENGPPLSMGWTMYQGEPITRPLVKVYVSTLIQGFVGPVRQRLEARLKLATGAEYVKDRHALKTYLMLSDVAHLDVDWATVELTRAWTEVLKPTSDISEFELKKRIRPHVRYYLGLVKAGRVTPVPADMQLVQKVQKTLQSIPARKRDYDMFVNALSEETYTKEGDELTEYKEYPSLSLNDLFQDRPEVLKILTSQTFEKEKRWKQIEGPYTDKAYLEVGKKIKLAYDFLTAEAWVVPLAPDETEKAIGDRLKYLRQDYETNYVIAWTEWLTDMLMKPPPDVGQAIDVYKVITTADYPLLRILRAVEDHTQFKKDASELQKQSKLAGKLDKELERQFSQRTGGLKIDVDSNKALAQQLQSIIPGTFRKLVEFGVPQDTKAGKSTGPIVETSFGKYINVLDVLRGTMLDMKAKNPNVDARVMGLQIQDAAKKTDALIAPLDDKGKAMLAPLLIAPLKVSGMRVSAGGKFY